MKKYEYVEVYIDKIIGSRSDSHREIIDEYAKKGYKYVGFIPVSMSNYGKIRKMDLVFEKDK